ncbi:MAG TPA: MarR family transcriptional regulator [Gemmatimonadaceae bacterium]|jgi:DNA-binding MarR family transcriptional regulator|nr:MarR family transcriptional regulator [Gemmatimonadaceae bacterium]
MKQSPELGVTPDAQVEDQDHGRYMVMLLEAARSIQERLEVVLAEVGLTSAKYQAIDALARAGEPLTLSELAGSLRCVRSNITQLVDRLEADGLVKRVDDPADRRAVRAVVTPLGMDRRADGTQAIAKLQDEVAAHVAPSERAMLDRVLGALK